MGILEIFNQRRLSDISFVVDKALSVSEGNRSFLKLFDITDPHIALSDYLPDADSKNLLFFLSNFSNENETKYFTASFRIKGRPLHCLLYFHEEGDVFHVDLKELSYAKELLDKALLESREYTAVLKSFDAHYFIYDGKKVVLKNTRDLTNMFEGPLGDFHGYVEHCFNVNVSDDSCRRRLDELFADLAECSVGKTYTLRTNDGDALSIRTHKVSTRSSALVLANISNGAFSEDAYGEQKDGLTDLYTKKAITEMIARKVDILKQPSTLIILDVDKFKECNDTFGHAFGDSVLATVSNVIKDAIRGVGVAGRIGGDEFIIALDKTSEEDIRSVTRKIRSGIQWSIPALDPGNVVTCSMGIARAPRDADGYDDLFALADKCLYIAKSKGRNCYIIYKPEMHGNAIAAGGKNANDMVSGQFFRESADKEIEILRLLGNAGGADDVRRVLEKTLAYMGVTKISVYGADLKPLFIVGKDDTDARSGSFDDEYFKFFNECGFLHLDNTNVLDTMDKHRFELYQKNGIASALEIKANGADGRFKLLVCYDIYKPARTFAKEKIVFAIVLASLIAQNV